MKTSELQGAALDWAVAKCEGRTITNTLGGAIWVKGRHEGEWEVEDFEMVWKPTLAWEQGGPIIEREWLCPDRLLNGQWMAAKRTNEGDSMLFAQTGPAPLIAAMRCFVASKLGDEVKIPNELL